MQKSTLQTIVENIEGSKAVGGSAMQMLNYFPYRPGGHTQRVNIYAAPKNPLYGKEKVCALDRFREKLLAPNPEDREAITIDNGNYLLGRITYTEGIAFVKRGEVKNNARGQKVMAAGEITALVPDIEINDAFVGALYDPRELPVTHTRIITLQVLPSKRMFNDLLNGKLKLVRGYKIPQDVAVGYEHPHLKRIPMRR